MRMCESMGMFPARAYARQRGFQVLGESVQDSVLYVKGYIVRSNVLPMFCLCSRYFEVGGAA